MTSKFKNTIGSRFILLLPLILLFVSVFNEFDFNYLNYKYFSFNFPFILIFYWSLKRSESLGYGFIFIAGLFNDVVMGFPLCVSSLAYLTVSLVATYIKNMTVNTRITTDWFTFFVAIFFSNLIFFILLINFSEVAINLTEISYNTFFTLIFFPFFWFLFTYYNSIITSGKNV